MLHLHQGTSYKLRDKAECLWTFKYEKNNGLAGWWGYRRRPGEEKPLCIGVFAEAEIIARLEEHMHPLSIDDRIDLELWFNHDGLENLIAESQEEVNRLGWE